MLDNIQFRMWCNYFYIVQHQLVIPYMGTLIKHKCLRNFYPSIN